MSNKLTQLAQWIESATTPQELAELLNMGFAETAAHWSDLHEGRSLPAIKASIVSDADILQDAINIRQLKGSWGILRHRAGEHHRTFDPCFDFSHAQARLKRGISEDNNFFYRTQEIERNYFGEQIAELLKEGEFNYIEKAQNLLDTLRNFEDGYYDQSGNLLISEQDIESKDFTSYSEDVYTYSIGFRFDSWEIEQEAETKTANQ